MAIEPYNGWNYNVVTNAENQRFLRVEKTVGGAPRAVWVLVPESNDQDCMDEICAGLTRSICDETDRHFAELSL